MSDLSSRLQPFIADSDDGPETVLYLKGFKDREEIHIFLGALVDRGVIIPPDRTPHRLDIVGGVDDTKGT